ncbi:Arm DNA-binding domain-containing protein [Microbispora sp. H13382]|uniref:Arm DNA-binding domain-containing protein n=1 Tax=Microbispora sp. H13382 TaxID=2729112 RepID=UPI001600320B|nr:hypothetical protein [Microbispora sp. H13382]
MKRGSTWSYVIRVKDPETGESKPKWVGGFAIEDEAKAARDEARKNARRGEYVDRNEITVDEYLDMWIEDHAMEIKPGTLEDYRISIRLYIKPHIGKMRLQAVRPSTVTKLYRDLLARGRGCQRDSVLFGEIREAMLCYCYDVNLDSKSQGTHWAGVR